jgi:hypothetical protein
MLSTSLKKFPSLLSPPLCHTPSSYRNEITRNQVLNKIVCSVVKNCNTTLTFSVYSKYKKGTLSLNGACGSVVVKALYYKPEGRGFDTRRGDFLNLPNPSGLTRPCDSLSL